ncbi:MAG: hypothetical protein D6756_00695, partial [Cyanobacteria bacterium J083]
MLTTNLMRNTNKKTRPWIITQITQVTKPELGINNHYVQSLPEQGQNTTIYYPPHLRIAYLAGDDIFLLETKDDVNNWARRATEEDM